MSAVLALLAIGLIPSTPDLGKTEAQCRPNEQGPAFLVSVEGLKDRQGLLKLELYPPDEKDFLEDDNILISQGKPFRRVEIPVPASSMPQLCIRAPAPGLYALMLLHDRNADHKLTISKDGIGFPNNPRLGWSKPRVERVTMRVGVGITDLHIVMNYNTGFFTFRPLHEKERPDAHR